MSYDVYCEFDAEKHKAKYVHYFEAVICSDGTVQYAVPSHQEKAIQLACKKLGVSRAELCEMTPREFYADWLSWLCEQAEIIAVWTKGFVGEPNSKQYNKLKALKLAGIYEGVLPSGRPRNIPFGDEVR